jgi:ankyrin repeat protein
LIYLDICFLRYNTSELIRFVFPFAILAIYFSISLLAFIFAFRKVSRATRWLTFAPLFTSLVISGWLVFGVDIVNSISTNRTDIIGAASISLFYTPAIALFLWALLYVSLTVARRDWRFAKLIFAVMALGIITVSLFSAALLFSKNVAIRQQTYFPRVTTLPFAVDQRFDNWLRSKQPRVYSWLTGRRIFAKPQPADLLPGACRIGDLEQVRQLVGNGADCNRPGKDGTLPLVEAARHDNIAVVNFLLAKGAKVNLQDAKGDSALGAAADYNSTDSAILLITAGADCNWVSKEGRYTPLMLAAWWQNNKLAGLLIKHGANPNATNGKNSPLSYAVTGNNFDLVKLLAAAGAKLQAADKLPKPLLSFAAANNHLKMMDYLLQQGVPVDEADTSTGLTPLMVATERDRVEAIDFLLRHGANVNLQNHQGYTPLMLAVSAAQASDETLDALIGAKANINIRDHHGDTALIHAAKNFPADLSALERLVKAGADLNLKNNAGETALTESGNLGHNEVVAYLQDKGAQITALHIIPQRHEGAAPLAKDKGWALAVSAIYAQTKGWDLQSLGGQEKSSAEPRSTLREDWNITNKQDLLAELQWLREEGDRKAYQEAGGKYAAMSDAEFAKSLSALDEDKALSGRAMRENYAKWRDRSAVAWDLCRYSYLVQMAYDAKYLKEDEAWNFLLANAREMQKHFSSWREMGQNFLDGRYIWAGERAANHENCYKLLANPADPNSPWNNIPWNYDLAEQKAAPGKNIPPATLDKAVPPR